MDNKTMPPLLRAGFLAHAKSQRHQVKIELAKQRIKEWLAITSKPYIAFSTGKDSTVTMHLVRSLAPQTVAVYFDADCAYPESTAMIQATENCLVFQTDETYLDALKRLSLESPYNATMETMVWRPVKRLIAQYGFDGVALGLRSAESRGRRMNARVRGSTYQYKRDGLWACQPLHDWSYQDIWAYIASHSIQYCGVYDHLWDLREEEQRVSYWAEETTRAYGCFSILRRTHPDLYGKLVSVIPEVSGLT